jgi:carbamate kinase
MDYADAHVQGELGYMFARALRNEFRARGMRREPVAVVTQVLVDRDDPAFREPTKPIGSPMDEATARRRAAELGWRVRRDPGRGWRRVVPSPVPREIVGLGVVARLAAAGCVVIACGGGGIPVLREAGGDLAGVEAVIDKDLASSLLARSLGAARLALATSVERVALDYGRPSQRWLERLTLAEAKRHYDAGQFDPGSMGPKVRALIEFLEAGGAEGVVTDAPHLAAALAGKAGTRFVRD